MNQLENKIIYQVYPKSFADSNNDGVGDLPGIIAKLDYITHLGVDYLWLSPINTSPHHDNGYDISDYYSIDPRFGTLNDYKTLIHEAKKRNCKIMMDLVLNHTSIQHEWFQKAIQGDPYYQNFYYFQETPTTLQSSFGGSAWNYEPNLQQYYLCVYDKTQADLNWNNPELRKEIYTMINYWINFGVEAFRLDVIDNLSKDLDNNRHSHGPFLITYIQELADNCFVGKNILTVGESYNPSFELVNAMCNDQGLTQSFHFTDTTHTQLQDKWHEKPFDLTSLVSIYDKWHNQYQGIPAWAMNNHDWPRLISQWLDDKNYRYESATLLITLYSILKGNLYLYQGEEIGMTNAYQDDIQWYNDIETQNAYKKLLSEGLSHEEVMQRIMKISRDNARVSIPWDASIHGGFSLTKPWLGSAHQYNNINVLSDLSQPTRSIYRYYQTILAFRKKFYHHIKEPIKFHIQDTTLKISSSHYQLYLNFSHFKKSINLPNSEIIISNYKDIVHNELYPYQATLFKPI